MYATSVSTKILATLLSAFAIVKLFTVHSRQAIVLVNIYTTYQDCQSLLFSGDCILGALTTCAYLPEWAQCRPCEANIPGLTAACLASDETELILIGGCQALKEHHTLLYLMNFWLVSRWMFKGLNWHFYGKVKAVNYLCGWQVFTV